MDKPTTILIVEDDPHSQAIIRLILRGTKYRLIFAAEGTQALAEVERVVPDLVLLDVMLPGELDGFDICRYLRGDGRLAAVPIIMVTARGDTAARLEAMQAGADDFVTKPFSHNELQSRVQAVVRFFAYRRLLFAGNSEEQVAHQLAEKPDVVAALHQTTSDLSEAASLEALVAALTEQVHALSFDLQPAMLSEVGLVPVLSWQFQRFQAQTGIEVMFEERGMDRRPMLPIETAVYRIVHVALINAARHDRVRQVRVQLQQQDRQLRLHVWHEGEGAAVEALALYQSGLAHLQRQARQHQGEVAVTQSPDRGAVLTASFPLAST